MKTPSIPWEKMEQILVFSSLMIDFDEKLRQGDTDMQALDDASDFFRLKVQ